MVKIMKIGNFLKIGQKFGKQGKIFKIGKIWKMGQNFQNRAKIKNYIGARHMRVKWAASTLESCAGIWASFTNDAYANTARGYAWFTRGISLQFLWPTVGNAIFHYCSQILKLIPAHLVQIRIYTKRMLTCLILKKL